MVGVGGLSGLSRFGVSPRIARQRLVPASANAFFVVAPVMGGALAYRFVRDNLGDPTTPAQSLGGDSHLWRLAGVGWMKNATGDPAAPDFRFSLDIGSQDYAFSFAGTYGGSYHGGEVASTNLVLANGVAVSPSVPSQATSFALQHSSVITWSAGNTAAVANYTLTINPDGTLSETLPISSGLNFTETLLGMLIAGDGAANGWSEVTLNAEGLTLPLLPGRAILQGHDDITIRNPANGAFIRSVSTTKSQPGYSRTEFRNTDTRSKLYHRFVGTLGGVMATRTISFGFGPAGPAFDKPNLLSNPGFAGGLSGWTVYAGSSQAVVSGKLRLTRQAAQESRIYQGFATEPGASYLSVTRASADTATTGGFHAAGSNANGSKLTPPPAFEQPAVELYNVQLWKASQTTHFHMLGQYAGTAGQQIDYDACAVYRLS